MTAVVISELRHHDKGDLNATFTVTLDDVVIVRGCILTMSLFTGRSAIAVPRRSNGSPVVWLSDALRQRIASAAAEAYADFDFPSTEAAA